MTFWDYQIYLMYNRHIFERHELVMRQKMAQYQESHKLDEKRRNQRQEKSQHYKSRVRDFLVQMAKHPLEVMQYIPPVTNIVREINQDLNLAHSQLFINSYKNNRERSQRVVTDNQILDCTPTIVAHPNHQFRSRYFQKQIQPSLRFGNGSPFKSTAITSSRSVTKLPSIGNANPEKLHFKGIQEMGNKLPSMEIKQKQKIGLINKLQTVYGGGEILLQKASLQILQSCGLAKSKTQKTLKSGNFISSSVQKNV